MNRKGTQGWTYTGAVRRNELDEETKRRAALLVALGAKDADDLRYLLNALGLTRFSWIGSKEPGVEEETP